MQKSSKKVILSVTNDLSTDQRVHKLANSLIKLGYLPQLVGIKRVYSKPLSKRAYNCKRLHLFFHSGWLFYANYNINLFFFLLFKRTSILLANDLDTLAANYLAYKIKKLFGAKHLQLIYDSHELFTEVPELNGRNFVKKVWLKLEQFILPNLQKTYTVCQSIADYYNKKYGIKMAVLRNLPSCNNKQKNNSEIDIQLPDNKKVILYQGALNIGRGLEQIIAAMNKIEDAVLIIAGKGDIEQRLHKKVENLKLQDKIIFTGVIPLEQLHQLTKRADIGLVLQEDISLSYRYVLPNRLFDFIQSAVPVLASNLPEIAHIVKSENIGILLDNLNSNSLVKGINELLNNQNLITIIKNNLRNCSHKYCWEQQENVLAKLLDC